jgi:hypothetical protein
VRKEANGPTNQKQNKTKKNGCWRLLSKKKSQRGEVSVSQSVSHSLLPDFFLEGTARFTYPSLDQSINQSINPHWPAVLWSEPVDKEKKKKAKARIFQV